MFTAPALEIVGMSKAFGQVPVLTGVNLSLNRRQILGLVGQNGAGKSTLMNILCGKYPYGSYDGVVKFDGREQRLRNPTDAIKQGIGMVAQETNVVGSLSVAENILLGTLRGWFRPRAAELETQAFLDQIGISMDVTQRVADCNASEQQLIMIAKALYGRPSLLILDEPTTALTAREVDRFFDIVNGLRDLDVSTILISHKLDEVFTLTDSVVVLRDGRVADRLEKKEFDQARVVKSMIGRNLESMYPALPDKAADQRTILEVTDLKVPSSLTRRAVRGVSFSLKAGEIVGLGGALGAGRTEVLEAIAGASPRTGEIVLNGSIVLGGNLPAAKRRGIALVPEDRKRDGLFLNFSIGENLVIGELGRFARRGWLRRLEVRLGAEEAMKSVGILGGRLGDSVTKLSGGNQQKTVIGRVLQGKPVVLLLDEPTKGVDIGAKAQIYDLLRQLALQGVAIVAAFSDSDELVGVSDRILLMHRGLIHSEIDCHGQSKENLMIAAFSGGMDAEEERA